jgi:hypothetical protein
MKILCFNVFPEFNIIRLDHLLKSCYDLKDSRFQFVVVSFQSKNQKQTTNNL